MGAIWKNRGQSYLMYLPHSFCNGHTFEGRKTYTKFGRTFLLLHICYKFILLVRNDDISNILVSCCQFELVSIATKFAYARTIFQFRIDKNCLNIFICDLLGSKFISVMSNIITENDVKL